MSIFTKIFNKEAGDAPPQVPPEATIEAGDIKSEDSDTLAASENVSGESEEVSTKPDVAPAAVEVDPFLDLADFKLVHLRSLMIAFESGERSEWIGEYREAVDALKQMAKECERAELSSALEVFGEAIATETLKTGELELAYQVLLDLEPGLFDYRSDREERESVVVDSLLRRATGFHYTALKRLAEARLTTLAAFADLSVKDLSKKAALEAGVATKIKDTVERYRGANRSPLSSPRPLEDLKQLKDSFVAFRTKHRAFEQIELNWSVDASTIKNELRQARAVAFLSVRLVLARLGELEQLARLERLPFKDRVEHLGNFLRVAAAREAGKTTAEEPEKDRGAEQ